MEEGRPMTKKIFAVVLSLVMVLCAVPLFASADDAVTAEQTVAAWDQNLAPVLSELFANEESTHWKYVAENDEQLSRTMLTYTVFALYDNAWKNGFDKSVSIDDAEKILCSLIEKIDANIGDSRLEEIIAVLQTASDANDLIQKANKFIKNDTIASEGWSDTFKYINYAIKALNNFKENRDRIIEVYARILSVQAANSFFKEMLEYISDNCSYDVVATAAENLIHKIDSSVEELLEEEIPNIVTVNASKAIEIGLRVAADTNAYTAVAIKVYDIGTSVADALWNTSDQYKLMDELYTTFFAETAVVDWAQGVKADADKYVFGVGAVLSLREIGAQTLYDLKIAQNGGIVGKISNQINLNVGFGNVAELAFVENAKEVLFKTDLSELAPVYSVVTLCSSAILDVDGTRIDNIAENYKSGNGYYYAVYNAGIANWVKSAFITTQSASVTLLSASDTLATLIVKRLSGGELVSRSFTDLAVGPEKVPSFYTTSDTFTYTTAEGAETRAFDTTFQLPSINAVTASSVANAAGAVLKDEANQKVNEYKGKVVNIGDALRKIFDAIVNAFKNIFKK